MKTPEGRTRIENAEERTTARLAQQVHENVECSKTSDSSANNGNGSSTTWAQGDQARLRGLTLYADLNGVTGVLMAHGSFD